MDLTQLFFTLPSRSASLCIAYFMRYHGMTLQTAYDYVKERRPIIHPNVGFWRQLREYEAKISARPPSRQDGGHPINGGDSAPLATGVKRKHNGELTPGMAKESFFILSSLCVFLLIRVVAGNVLLSNTRSTYA